MELQEVKNYLRVDFNDDDNFIIELIEVTEIYVDTSCGTAYKNHEHLVKLSKLAKLKLISNMYEKREANATEKRDLTIATIFDTLSHAEVI